MEPFKVVSIGGGHIANWGHGPSLAQYAKENPGVELGACCDLDLEKAVAFQKSWGFQRVYQNIDEMLEKEKPQAVSLVVPEPVTARLAAPILEKGIPLLMEKPPGAHVGETRQLVEAAKRGGGFHAVAFNRRHMPLVKAFQKEVLSTGIPLSQIRYEMIRSGRLETTFHQTAIHGLDLVIHLAASAVVSARLVRSAPALAPAGAVNFDVGASFASGLEAQWVFSPMAGTIFERVSAHSFGHSFYLYLPVWGCLDTPGSLEHYHQNKCVQKIKGDELAGGQERHVTNGFYGEIKSFLDHVRRGEAPPDTLTSALGGMELAEALAKGQTQIP